MNDFLTEKNKKTELKEAFPELKDVVLVTGVSDDLIAQARQIMRQRKEAKKQRFSAGRLHEKKIKMICKQMGRKKK